MHHILVTQVEREVVVHGRGRPSTTKITSHKKTVFLLYCVLCDADLGETDDVEKLPPKAKKHRCFEMNLYLFMTFFEALPHNVTTGYLLKLARHPENPLRISKDRFYKILKLFDARGALDGTEYFETHTSGIDPRSTRITYSYRSKIIYEESIVKMARSSPSFARDHRALTSKLLTLADNIISPR